MPIPMVHENVCIVLMMIWTHPKNWGTPILWVKNYKIWRCYDFTRLDQICVQLQIV